MSHSSSVPCVGAGGGREEYVCVCAYVWTEFLFLLQVMKIGLGIEDGGKGW